MDRPAVSVNSPSKSESLETEFRRLSQHIALIEKLTFASAPLERTFKGFRLPLYLREHGCWCSDLKGEGKTTAIEYCAKALRAENPDLPVFVINQYVLPGNDLRSFFFRALIESNHECTTGAAGILRQRLAHLWAELSRQSPLGHVVLLIDEGQAIRGTDLILLKDLSNDMAHLSGALQSFTFGESPKLETRVNELKSVGTGGGGEVDRIFGGRRLTLHHYETDKDWESLFVQMDTQQFDVFDDKTVAEFFFGHVDISKFKFKNETKSFWQALKTVEKQEKTHINLRRIFFAIRFAVHKTMESTLFAEIPVPLHAFQPELWDEALFQALCSSDKE